MIIDAETIRAYAETAYNVTPNQISAVGDEIQTQFDLDSMQVQAIASSSSFGHAMQFSREAPMFVGYQIDIPQGKTSQKVGAFLRNCLSR